MNRPTTKFKAVENESPKWQPDDVFKFLISRPTWKREVRALLAAVKREGLYEFRGQAFDLKVFESRQANFWFVRNRLDPSRPDRPTMGALAAILRWWEKHPYSLGDIAVMTDKALRDRYFPFIPSELNTIFPEAKMFRAELDRLGLPGNLSCIDGSPLHLVAGVIPLTHYIRNRHPSPVETWIHEVTESAPHIMGLDREIESEEATLVKLEALARKPSAIRVHSPAAKPEKGRERAEVARIASVLKAKAPELMRAGSRLMFTTAELYELCRQKRYLSMPDLQPRERHRLVGAALGRRGLGALVSRFGRRQWFLPSLSMTGVAKQAFMALDFDDRLGLYHFLLQSLVGKVRFIDYPGPQPIVLNEDFWDGLVAASFTVCGKRFSEFMRINGNSDDVKGGFRPPSLRHAMEPACSTQLRDGLIRGREHANLSRPPQVDFDDGISSRDQEGDEDDSISECRWVRIALERLARHTTHPVLAFDPSYRMEDADY